MSIKLNKEAYEKLISEDIKALNGQMSHCPESSHIESVLRNSISWYYPDKHTCSALARIQNRLTIELERQKESGKKFVDAKEIDAIIDSIIEEMREQTF